MRHVHISFAKMTDFSNVAELVRAARNDLNQAEFARMLGVKQSTVSRYERGRASPPTKIVDRCMHLMNEGAAGGELSAEALAERIRVGLAAPGLADVRRAIASVLDAVLTQRPGGRAGPQAKH